MRHEYSWAMEDGKDGFRCDNCNKFYANSDKRPIRGCTGGYTVDFKKLINSEIRRKLGLGSEHVER